MSMRRASFAENKRKQIITGEMEGSSLGQIIWTYTVRHTGTHFMFAHLQQMGFSQSGAKFLHKLRGSGARYFIHEHLDQPHNTNQIYDDKVVVTMRNPVDVYRSHIWRRRINDKPGEYEKMLKISFYRLLGMIKFFDAFMFRVDAPDQKVEVKKLAEWIDIEEWECKEEMTNINTARTTPNYMGTVEQELFENPPSAIFELANEFGY